MTTRILLVACAFGSLAFSQELPTYQWVKEVDASGTDSFAGLGTDAQGNIYVAGSTMSASYPTKAAVQGSITSSGLYRIAQTTCPVMLCLVNGSIWTALGLNSASAIAVDPQNDATLYAVSARKLVKSSDGGVTFAGTSLPSSFASAIALEPGNSRVVFVATLDLGVLKSADGGATWTAVNNGIPVQAGGQVSVQNLWIDPANPAVILAKLLPSALVRSVDGAANWQLTTITDNFQDVTFDTANPGVLYVCGSVAGPTKSTDYGQTFNSIGAPTVSDLLPDQNHPGQLIGIGPCGVCLSTDGGTTWTQESGARLSQVVNLAPDWQNDVIYAAAGPGVSVVRISGDLRSVTPVGPPATGFISGLAVANGQVYAANLGSADVFVTKLDPLGNIVYSTYLGGSGNDGATAMAVDATGNVFVAGTTGSLDFPVSKGAYASSGNAFVFKLNPDGSLGYSTYFSGTTPLAIATDGNGSAWLGGNSQGGLLVTPSALSMTCSCGPFPGGFMLIIYYESSLTRFDAAGSSLIFSTYVPGSSATTLVGQNNFASPLAVTPDGTAYLGGANGVFQIDRTGTSLLSSIPWQGPGAHTAISPVAMTVAPDGSLYIAGGPGDQFQATAGAFQSTLPGPPTLPNQFTAAQFAVERIDAGLKGVIDATYFSNPYSNLVSTMAIDGAGNVYLGGSTAPLGLPTRTPFQGGFASPTGFMSKLSGDLSTLLFSSYFGDNENFTVAGVGIGANGSVVIGGVTGRYTGQPNNLWLNSLALALPPTLRIDAVENAASLVDTPLSAGETIVIKGAGFGSDARISIGDDAVTPLSITSTAITATVPADISAGATAIQVQSGGASSNQVLMPVAIASPGIFSADGTGYGQGYILNKDGTPNTPANPAAPGDMITILATGVGPVSFTEGYAVTEFPVNVFIDGFYCNGVAATMGAVSGLPGSVYRITVYVPNPAVVFAGILPGFTFPPLSGVVMQINGASSQIGIAISIAP